MSGLEMNLTHYSNLTFAGRNEVCKLFGDEPNSTLTSPSKPCGAERGLQVGSGFSNPAGRNEVCKSGLDFLTLRGGTRFAVVYGKKIEKK